MSAAILALVLAAALMHALWNAMLKSAGDGAIMVGFIALGHVIPGLVLVMIVPLPNPAAWKFIVASTVIHWLYYYLLNKAYRSGDLSVVYPIARGLTPMMIALASWLLLGEALGAFAWLGVGAVSGGIFLLVRPDRLAHVPPVALWAAVGTALSIAMYSLADGMGVRASGSALSYVAWLFAAEISVVAYVFGTHSARLRRIGGRTVALGLAGGMISALAYGMVLWAMAIAPLGLVSATREVSVIFAALIGVLWFREGPRRQRLLAAVVVFSGVFLMVLG